MVSSWHILEFSFSAILSSLFIMLSKAQTEGDVGYDYYDAYEDFYDEVALGREPKFDVPVVNVTVVAGQTALLPCTIDMLGKHKVTWQGPDQHAVPLTLEDRRIVDDPRFGVLHMKPREWHLQISYVKWDDQGVYLCTINTKPSRHKQVSLHVKVPPRIIDALSSEDTTVKEGETIVLICNSTGVPPPRITWFRSTATNGYGVEDEREKIELQGAMLILRNVSRHCDDMYECVAENGVAPAAYRKFRVTVEFPPEISLRNPRIGQFPGKDTILVCSITAFPQSLNSWMRGDDIISSSTKYRIEAYDEMGANTVHLNLYIKDVEKADYGEYKCKASNYLGVAEDKMELYRSVETYGYNYESTRRPQSPRKPNHPRDPPDTTRGPHVRVHDPPADEPQFGAVGRGMSRVVHSWTMTFTLATVSSVLCAHFLL